MSSAAPQPGTTRLRASRIAESAVSRARLTVVPRRRSASPRVPFLALVTLVLVGGVVGLLLFNTSMQQASFAASGLEDRVTALTAHEQSLTMELEGLRDPQRIAEQAQRLGMVLPTTWCSVHVGGPAASCKDGASVAAPPLRIRPLPPAKPASLDPDPVVVHLKPKHDTGAASRDGGKHRGSNGDQGRRQQPAAGRSR
ncbi:MAG: hypothetical protein U0R80_11985 [Nocardioidaceae bacterium]